MAQQLYNFTDVFINGVRQMVPVDQIAQNLANLTRGGSGVNALNDRGFGTGPLIGDAAINLASYSDSITGAPVGTYVAPAEVSVSDRVDTPIVSTPVTPPPVSDRVTSTNGITTSTIGSKLAIPLLIGAAIIGIAYTRKSK